MTGTVGPEYYDEDIAHMSEPLRNPISGDFAPKPLTVLYCLHQDCPKQCVLGSMEWTADLDLTRLSVQPILQMGYCTEHDPNSQ